MHGYRTIGLPVQNTCYRCTARTRSGSVSHANTAFPEGDFDFVAVQYVNEFHIGAIWKCGMPLELRTDALNIRVVKPFDKYGAMRIASRTGSDLDNLVFQLHRVIHH